MALIECQECNEKISDSAKACPKCGAPTLREKFRIPGYILSTVGAIGSLSFIFSVGALLLSLVNRECRAFFSNRTAELYWSCVGDHLTIYHAGIAFKFWIIALVIFSLLVLMIDKLGYKN